MPRYYVAWFSISMAIRIFPNPSFYAIDKHFRRTQLSAKYSIVKHILHVCHYDYYRALCPPHAWTWPRATQTQPPLIWKLLLTILAPSAPSVGEPVHFAWILGIFILYPSNKWCWISTYDTYCDILCVSYAWGNIENSKQDLFLSRSYKGKYKIYSCWYKYSGMSVLIG